MKILNGRGFSQENILMLQKTYKNKFLLTSQADKSVFKGAEKGSDTILSYPLFIIITLYFMTMFIK